MAAGLLLGAAWYHTILAGFYILYCPVLYIMFFNHTLYRKLVDVLFALWELYPVGLFQWCCKTELHHFGDYVDPDEKTIIVMNHRTRVDWNYVWLALYHATQDHNTKKIFCIDKVNPNVNKRDFLDNLAGGKSKIKFVLKDEIKNVPGMGWIMQLNFFLYVKRNWQQDQVNLSQFMDYYQRLRYDCRIVLFPEGTDLSEDNKRRGEKFANTHNMPLYQFVLHPRTMGWLVLCARLRRAGLNSVYDVTVAYDKPAQTEADLLRGNIPRHVYFHFKRYPIETLPEDDDELKPWLSDRWKEKEENLRTFHEKGHFIDSTTKKQPIERAPRSLNKAKIAFTVWTGIDIIFIYALLNSTIFQFWVLYHTIMLVFVTWYFGGFHNIQYKLLDKLQV